MNINPVFELLRNDGSIIINKALIHRLGLHEAIIYTELVSRYAYFSKESMLTEDGYFYNTVDDLQLATGLGEKAQNTAIKNLMTLGIIDKKLKGTPARRHFKISDDMNLILSLIEEGKTIIKELDQKQKERMKQKIQYSKFSSSEKTEVEYTRDNISNSSSSDKTELIPTTGRINNTNTIILNNNTKKNREEDSSVLSTWDNTITILKGEMTEVSFNTWIISLSALRIEDSVLILKAQNEFTKSVVLTKFKDLINTSIKLANNSVIGFNIEI
ncbi:hypothetical protein G9F71_013635 [Clostridium sp. FP2]|uniref:DnaA N-terminal domain-containing protein n=1 Tax=Clostridium TaxID=1485 RepID=UPI0013E942C7|nr:MULTISPECIES: DnaA N-terminal domain-containing protein [Clostridium]MBW9157812.1 hypothetical protein [Clostridium tagluense]MBZ9623888.1 hypothetical protein [Clostridium sp. FP2]WLC63787.1 hypothetical protein KTC93_12925 [Clostridium tagluense]